MPNLNRMKSAHGNLRCSFKSCSCCSVDRIECMAQKVQRTNPLKLPHQDPLMTGDQAHAGIWTPPGRPIPRNWTNRLCILKLYWPLWSCWREHLPSWWFEEPCSIFQASTVQQWGDLKSQHQARWTASRPPGPPSSLGLRHDAYVYVLLVQGIRFKLLRSAFFIAWPLINGLTWGST